MELKTLDTQIAGHTEQDPGSENLPRFLIDPRGFVFKPIPGSRGVKELEFYKTSVHHLKNPSLLKFISRFDKEIEVKSVKYMGIEDLTCTYSKEFINVSDIKMGTQTYDSQASEEKIRLETAKAAKTTTTTLGFRFCGATITPKPGAQTIKLSKDWGKDLTKDNMFEEGLKRFFTCNGSFTHTKMVVAKFLQLLNDLLQWFKSNQQFAFYSSSLLFVFGTFVEDPKHPHNVHIVDEKSRLGVSLKMIDFAHVDKIENKTDEGYITGLENLIRMLERLL